MEGYDNTYTSFIDVTLMSQNLHLRREAGCHLTLPAGVSDATVTGSVVVSG